MWIDVNNKGGGDLTKEKAIMELMCNAGQEEVLECCQKILEGYPELSDLTGAIIKRKKEIEKKNEELYDIAAGGKFELENI